MTCSKVFEVVPSSVTITMGASSMVTCFLGEGGEGEREREGGREGGGEREREREREREGGEGGDYERCLIKLNNIMTLCFSQEYMKGKEESIEQHICCVY